MTCAKQINAFLKAKYTILLLAIPILFFGCKRPPDYPDIPEITFESIEYIEADGMNSFFDTIRLAVYFQDGDGDLGLNADQIDDPYNPYNVELDINGDSIRFGDPGATSFNFYDYEVVGSDSFKVERNPHFFNFLVEFYEETSPGTFEHKDYRNWCINNNVCIPFHGRFEPLSEGSKTEPLEGTISYSMLSSQFPKGNVKFKIKIFDRSLNESNTVESTIINIK